MFIGYARNSLFDSPERLDAQVSALSKAGCERVFKELMPSTGEREELNKALDSCGPGDRLVVMSLDRLARNTLHLLEVVHRLEKQGAELKVIDIGLDTATSTGRVMRDLLVALGQFERAMMRERQREGISKAKLEGKYKGRAPTARAMTERVLELQGQGLTRQAIAIACEISVASVYRILSQQK